VMPGRIEMWIRQDSLQQITNARMSGHHYPRKNWKVP
jgi:hypothetical protein